MEWEKWGKGEAGGELGKWIMGDRMSLWEAFIDSESSSCVSPSVVITGNVFMNVFVQFLSNSLLFGVLEF